MQASRVTRSGETLPFHLSCRPPAGGQLACQARLGTCLIDAQQACYAVGTIPALHAQ
jgi:hypothetical protein